MSYSISNGNRWGCLIAATGVVLILIVAYASMTGYLPIQFFDSQKWKQVERSDDYTRLQMIEHLMKSGRLDNATRSEVISLLGSPGETSYFSEWDLVYWLGPERGFLGIDSEWLVIRFGPSDVVSEYRVVRD